MQVAGGCLAQAQGRGGRKRLTLPTPSSAGIRHLEASQDHLGQAPQCLQTSVFPSQSESRAGYSQSPCCRETPRTWDSSDQVVRGPLGCRHKGGPPGIGNLWGWWMEREESDHPAQLGHTENTGATKVLENRLPVGLGTCVTHQPSFLSWSGRLVEHHEPTTGWKEQPRGLAHGWMRLTHSQYLSTWGSPGERPGTMRSSSDEQSGLSYTEGALGQH